MTPDRNQRGPGLFAPNPDRARALRRDRRRGDGVSQTRSNGPGPSLIGGPFKLETADGKTVTDADFLGKPFLVYFGYTHCPDVCPTTLAEISDVLKRLPDKPLKVLFITVDPERDIAEADGRLCIELRSAHHRPFRQRRRDRGDREDLSGLRAQGADQRWRLCHGPFLDRLSDERQGAVSSKRSTWTARPTTRRRNCGNFCDPLALSLLPRAGEGGAQRRMRASPAWL